MRLSRSYTAIIVGVALSALLAVAAGCGSGEGSAVERSELILATTTSTQDSGLLDEWVPMFEDENPYSVKVIAVGSGEAMSMGREGECDVMLVHSPAAEEEMVVEGYAVDRKAVMHNDFILVGPASDPAGVKGAETAKDAFSLIAASRAEFISRGDESGTHTKELKMWDEAGIEPAGEWYVESGKGMGDTLRIANEREAYTIADRGTYLSLKDSLELEVLSEGDPAYFNNYHVMNVNPEKYPDVNAEGAQAFNSFCVSREAQESLNEFGVQKYGEPLFYPDAL